MTVQLSDSESVVHFLKQPHRVMKNDIYIRKHERTTYHVKIARKVWWNTPALSADILYEATQRFTSETPLLCLM